MSISGSSDTTGHGVSADQARFLYGVYVTVALISVLWLIKLVEWASLTDWGVLGIYPRTLRGSVGIITSPFIHGDIFHLLSNSIPLVILSIGVFYFYDRIAWKVLFMVLLITGFLVWFFGRPAYHIGASGLVYGLIAFLLFSGLLRKDGKSTVVSLIVIFLYGGTMFTGMAPGKAHISWESHAFGAFTGMALAFYYRNTPLWIDEKEEAASDEDSNESASSPINHTIHSTSSKETNFIYTYKPDASNKKV